MDNSQLWQLSAKKLNAKHHSKKNVTEQLREEARY
jgi:hypothetical protein